MREKPKNISHRSLDYREGYDAGQASIEKTRCLEHLLVPPLNRDERSGVECPICYFKEKRKRLNLERKAITHHFEIGGEHDGYITVGLYLDGTPGEIFLTMSKQGTTIRGLLDCWAIMVSMALQYGVPLIDICTKFAYTSFEPSGNTPTELHYAKSVVDYVSRWLALKFLPRDEAVACGLVNKKDPSP